MSKFNIAVTGVGGGVGQSILKSLYGTDYNVIGLDGETLAAGLYAVGSAYKIPYANSPAYIPALLEICEREKCKLLFPGLDAELMVLSDNRDKFAAIGTTVVVSDKNVITISDDKMATFDQLTALGFRVPRTIDLTDWMKDMGSLDYPIIAKQKVGGARSKNVYLLKKKADGDAFLKMKDLEPDNFIVQEYIEGDEYTCGSVNLEGECKGVIVMRRILRDGDTYKCFSEHNPVIEGMVRSLVNAIKPFGACNVQLRMKDGVPYVFEINARCSGTTASRTLCGFNEPKMIADFLLKGIAPSYVITERTILRYWKELVVENDQVAAFKSAGSINNEAFTSL